MNCGGLRSDSKAQNSK
uniref:Uncharacterized protein n=1 Tax=Anguilla anguilla TaxID=7936 RepID=A0A0E9VJ21_ANGAN